MPMNCPRVLPDPDLSTHNPRSQTNRNQGPTIYRPCPCTSTGPGASSSSQRHFHHVASELPESSENCPIGKPGVATPRPTHPPFRPCSFVRAVTLHVRSSRAVSLQPSHQRRASVCGPAAALRSGFVLLDAFLHLRSTSPLADRRPKPTRQFGQII